MRIKENVNLVDFLKVVKTCKDEVYFETTEGDSLALRSQLCQFVFCSLYKRPEILYSGNVRFKNLNDMVLLEEFLTK